MSAAVKGKSVEKVRETIATFKQLMTVHQASLDEASAAEPLDLRALGELAALQGVVKFPVRIKCATLAWNTLSQGLDELE
jgi:nitrogen fixation NifU-like protein